MDKSVTAYSRKNLAQRKHFLWKRVKETYLHNTSLFISLHLFITLKVALYLKTKESTSEQVTDSRGEERDSDGKFE